MDKIEIYEADKNGRFRKLATKKTSQEIQEQQLWLKHTK